MCDQWTFMSCLYVLVFYTTSEDGYSHTCKTIMMLIVKTENHLFCFLVYRKSYTKFDSSFGMHQICYTIEEQLRMLRLQYNYTFHTESNEFNKHLPSDMDHFKQLIHCVTDWFQMYISISIEKHCAMHFSLRRGYIERYI